VGVKGWASFGAEDKTKFWLGENTDDEHKQNNSPTRLLIAFRAISTEAVDQFYQAAIDAGATDNGKSGMRETYHPN
jgi:predicted lactoylglutathione lyase